MATQTHKCPKCGESIHRTWVNKKRGHQLVGYCPAEKKTVNLGKAEPDAEIPAAQIQKDGGNSTPKVKAAAKPAAKKHSPPPADLGKRIERPGPVQPAGAIPKRSRASAFFRGIFELD